MVSVASLQSILAGNSPLILPLAVPRSHLQRKYSIYMLFILRHRVEHVQYHQISDIKCRILDIQRRTLKTLISNIGHQKRLLTNVYVFIF